MRSFDGLFFLAAFSGVFGFLAVACVASENVYLNVLGWPLSFAMGLCMGAFYQLHVPIFKRVRKRNALGFRLALLIAVGGLVFGLGIANGAFMVFTNAPEDRIHAVISPLVSGLLLWTVGQLIEFINKGGANK